MTVTTAPCKKGGQQINDDRQEEKYKSLLLPDYSSTRIMITATSITRMAMA
jgi:hypothetical protein